MSPTLLLLILAVSLLALIPVRRLSVAGWSASSLFTAWVLYTAGLFVGLRFPGAARLVLPVLVVAFVLPFVAGPERLTRLFGGRKPRVVIDVTPKPAPGLGAPPPNPKPVQPADAAGTAEAAARRPADRTSQRWIPGRPGRKRRPPEEER